MFKRLCLLMFIFSSKFSIQYISDRKLLLERQRWVVTNLLTNMAWWKPPNIFNETNKTELIFWLFIIRRRKWYTNPNDCITNILARGSSNDVCSNNNRDGIRIVPIKRGKSRIDSWHFWKYFFYHGEEFLFVW